MVEKQGSLTSDHSLRRYQDVRDLIASPENPTPLLRTRRRDDREGLELYLKLEWFNPFGSIKDRTARFLLQGLEERGELDGKELIEKGLAFFQPTGWKIVSDPAHGKVAVG